MKVTINSMTDRTNTQFATISEKKGKNCTGSADIEVRAVIFSISGSSGTPDSAESGCGGIRGNESYDVRGGHMIPPSLIDVMPKSGCCASFVSCQSCPR